MTQKEIARKAGVSVATISRVLNNESGVSSQTRQRIAGLFDEYAYVRNNNARNLRTSRSKAIGFLMSNIANPFFIAIYQGLEPVCKKHGFNIILGNTNESIQQEKEAIDLFLSYRVDGLIASFVDPQESTLKKLSNYGTSIIALDRQQRNIDTDTVIMDNLNSAKEQVYYLASLGHKRIAVIYGTTNNLPGEDRLKGYRSAMRELGFSALPGYEVSGRFNEEEAYNGTIGLFRCIPPPTAVVVHNNLMCIGAYKAIKDLGLKIPKDVSLVGFDNFDFADYLNPGLTFIERSLQEAGRISGEMVIERIEKKYEGNARIVVLPYKLRINESCAPPAKEEGYNE
ncbi:MAG: LacI family transcriptional regulator [Treponema sp.]|nr:LacI family transcriptional regulator [Treponema sp.]